MPALSGTISRLVLSDDGRSIRRRRGSVAGILALALGGTTAILPTEACGQPKATGTAAMIVARAIAAQGGAERLRAIRTVQWSATGYRNMLEQSERPEGPYITEFQTVTEADDYAADRHRSVVAATVYPFGTSTAGIVLSGGIGMSFADQSRSAATALQVQAAREKAALSPERLLLTAAAANDLRRGTWTHSTKSTSRVSHGAAAWA